MRMEVIAEEMEQPRVRLNAALQSVARPPSVFQPDVEDGVIGRELLELQRSVDLIWNIPDALPQAVIPKLRHEVETLRQQLMVKLSHLETGTVFNLPNPVSH